MMAENGSRREARSRLIGRAVGIFLAKSYFVLRRAAMMVAAVSWS